jgi:outer membrane protein assembly factor BamB
MVRVDVGNKQHWPSHRFDPENTGSIESNKFYGKFDVLWESKAHDRPTGPLTIVDNKLLYPSTLKRIKLFDSKTGKYSGYIKTKGIPYTGISIVDSLGYFTVAPRRNKLKCINLLNNKTLWEKKVKDAAGGSIIINNSIIVGTADGKLLSVNRFNGELIWTFQSNSRFHQPPAIKNGVVYQAGDNGFVYGINLEDGTELFKTELGNPIAASVTVGKLIYVADIKGQVYGLDLNNGSVKWQTNIGGPVWSPGALSQGVLLYGNTAGDVVALNTFDGSVIWRYNVNEVIRASILIVNEIVIFATMPGKLFSLSIKDGSVIEQITIEGPLARSPISDGKRVYVATERGKITCFGEKNETIEKINEGKLFKY